MSEEFLSFILAIAVIITAAKTAGYISARLGQPSVLGEMIVGILLGPTVINMLNSPIFEGEIVHEAISFMAELGVILLMFVAGLELHLGELLKAGKASALSGSLGVFTPLVMGWGTAVLFGAEGSEALFVGLILAATSVSISAQTLLELGVLRTKVGLTMLGAAVFDDILVLLALSVAFIGVSGSGGFNDILLAVGAMVLFIAVASAVGLFLLPHLAYMVERRQSTQGLIAFVLVIALLYAWTAEVVGGLAAITGAFMAGLFMARLSFKPRIEEGLAAMAYSFFVPIFFVHIGLGVDLRAISGSEWILAIALTLVAVASKIIGAGVGAKMSKFSNKEALQLGIGMVSRGEVGLIVASFALTEALIRPATFSITVFMIIAATLLTPPLLRLSFAKSSVKEAQA